MTINKGDHTLWEFAASNGLILVVGSFSLYVFSALYVTGLAEALHAPPEAFDLSILQLTSLCVTPFLVTAAIIAVFLHAVHCKASQVRTAWIPAAIAGMGLGGLVWWCSQDPLIDAPTRRAETAVTMLMFLPLIGHVVSSRRMRKDRQSDDHAEAELKERDSETVENRLEFINARVHELEKRHQGFGIRYFYLSWVLICAFLVWNIAPVLGAVAAHQALGRARGNPLDRPVVFTDGKLAIVLVIDRQKEEITISPFDAVQPQALASHALTE